MAGKANGRNAQIKDFSLKFLYFHFPLIDSHRTDSLVSADSLGQEKLTSFRDIISCLWYGDNTDHLQIYFNKVSGK